MSIGKRILIFVFISILSVWLGFFAFSHQEISSYYMVLIYYFLTFGLIIWLVSIIDACMYNYKVLPLQLSRWQSLKSFIKGNWLAFVAAIALMSIGFSVCKPDFRILSDEAVILSDTKSLSESKISVLPLSSVNTHDGKQIVFDYIVDKRPLFFQYLVSLIHSSFGYNSNNIFIANFIFSVLSLFLFYHLIQLKFGKVWGICGLILLGSYPLYLLYSACAGFELFNLFCSLVLFLCLYKYIRNPNAALAEVLVLGIPLIGQSRYESILVILIIIPVVVYLLPKVEYSKLSYKILFFPLLCVPIPWLRRISDTSDLWEHKEPADVFGFRFVYNNLKNAVECFFVEKPEYCIISAVSFVAVLGFLILIRNLFKNQVSKNSRTFWAGIFAFYALHALVRFMYVRVDFRHATANRLALLFLPAVVFFAIYLLIKCNEKYKKKYFPITCLVLVCSLPFIYWSDLSRKHCGYNHLVAYLEYRASRNILNKYYQNKKDYCLICRQPFIYSPLGYSAIEDYILYKYSDAMEKCIENDYFKYYLTMQVYTFGKPDFEIPQELDAKLEKELDVDGKTKIIFSRCVPKSR